MYLTTASLEQRLIGKLANDLSAAERNRAAADHAAVMSPSEITQHAANEAGKRYWAARRAYYTAKGIKL